MRLSMLSGLAGAVAVAGLFVSGCDRDGNLVNPEVVTAGEALTSDSCEPSDPACLPTGAHQKHGAYACGVCHAVAGRVAFSVTGPARGSGQPAPAFNATTKTCSNVACHAVPAGSYTYWFPGGDGEPELRVATYGGAAAATTPSWYATGSVGCSACHGNPPANYPWHGAHAGGNQCELCHRDAVSAGGVATGLDPTYAAEHANGTLNVTARFVSRCFGCH